MKSQWDTWLRQLAADGKGGASIRSIDRGLPYELTIALGADVSGDAFAAALVTAPDNAAKEAEFDITVSAYVGGVTTLTLELSAADTAGLAADGDYDGLTELLFDILRTPSGGTQGRMMGGNVFISGKVTDYGS